MRGNNTNKGKSTSGAGKRDGKKPFSKKTGAGKRSFGPPRNDGPRTSRTGNTVSGPKEFAIPKTNTNEIRLNKYLSDAGICSRRDADTLITAGTVEVNGEVITQLGYKVKPTDEVKYGGDTLKRDKNVYFVLNKPKNFVTKLVGNRQARNVMELMKRASKEFIYPVGHLDKSTTGILVFTNDSNMSKKLTHPRLRCKKIFHITTEKPVSGADLDAIRAGVELKDGVFKPDAVEFVGTGENKREIGLEFTSNKHKVEQRLMDHFGYKIAKIDLVSFAGLNKKNLPRGHYRALTENEIAFLKML